MSVHAKVAALVESPVDAEGADAFLRAVSGDSVHYAVWARGYPVAVIDGSIGRLYRFAAIEKEGADYFILVIYTNVTFFLTNILANYLFRRPVTRSPLGRIAVIRHKLSGISEDFHHTGNVLLG